MKREEVDEGGGSRWEGEGRSKVRERVQAVRRETKSGDREGCSEGEKRGRVRGGGWGRG